MKVRLIKAWDTLSSSYWFIPSVMAVGAVALAVALTVVDARIGSDWLDLVPWLRENRPEGARTVLATLAGSMITVAGVAFSITIVAVSYASTQFGPRIITTFMRDRGNQITLGTFIATFLYCLTVLRTIWSPGEPAPGAAVTESPFVPHLAMLGAFFFAVGSLGVLIYFVHHVPRSFLVGTVVAGIGERLSDRFRNLAAEAEDPGRRLPSVAERATFDGLSPDAATRVLSRESGYVHNVDWDGILAAATRHDLKVHWLAAPGRFIRKGEALALVWDGTDPGDEASSGADAGSEADRGWEAGAGLRSFVAMASRRTEAQDALFPVDELVEIAARALSPGINDPFTANTCVDWLTAALLQLEGRALPAPPSRDEGGTVRVLTTPVGIADLAERIFGQLRPYVARDRIAASHVMAALGTLYLAARSGKEKDVVLEQTRLLMEAVEEVMELRSDVAAVRRHHDVVKTLHDEPDRRLELLRENAWLGTT